MGASDARAAAGGLHSGQDDAETFELQQLRAMEQSRWNEARLDDLNRKVDEGFKETREAFARIDATLVRIDEKFDRKFDRLQWLLLASAAGIIATLISF